MDFENFGGFGRVSRVGLGVGLCNPYRGGPREPQSSVFALRTPWLAPPVLLGAHRLKRDVEDTGFPEPKYEVWGFSDTDPYG